jgi:hypothetical protein
MTLKWILSKYDEVYLFNWAQDEDCEYDDAFVVTAQEALNVTDSQSSIMCENWPGSTTRPHFAGLVLFC